MWDKLHATPYGRFDRMVPPPPATFEGAHASRVNFDHYQIASGPAVVDREFPRGEW